MAEKSSDSSSSSTSLTSSSREVIPSYTYMLQVPNIFSVKDYAGGTRFESSTFEFADATWNFQFFSCISWRNRPNRDHFKAFSVYMERLYFELSNQVIFYSVILLDANKEKYNEFNGVRTFGMSDNVKRIYMAHFRKGKPGLDKCDSLTLIVRLFTDKRTNGSAHNEKIVEVRDDTAERMVHLDESAMKNLYAACYTLKTPNLFTLPEYDGSVFESPTFVYADATWNFRCSSDKKWQKRDEEETEDVKPKEIKVEMIRLDSDRPRQMIYFKVILLGERNEVYDSSAEVFLSKDSCKTRILAYFKNFYPSFDKRSTLTLIIHLFYDTSTKVDAHQLQNATDIAVLSFRPNVKEFFLSGRVNDVTFKVCGEEFKAHRDILEAHSEVFCSMFSHDMLERSSGVINVPDCDPQEFEMFLNYAYTGEIVALNEKNAFNLYYLADKYNVARLKDECREVIKHTLSVTNLGNVIEFAYKHIDADLLNFIKRYFSNYGDVIWSSAEWQLFIKENYSTFNDFMKRFFENSQIRKVEGLSPSMEVKPYMAQKRMRD